MSPTLQMGIGRSNSDRQVTGTVRNAAQCKKNRKQLKPLGYLRYPKQTKSSLTGCDYYGYPGYPLEGAKNMEYQINIKLDEVQNQMIDRLAERHDCSRAEAVRKAVQLVAEADGTAPQLEAKIDAIGETTIEILRLLQQHAEQSVAAIVDTRSWVQRSMFFGRALATKFEVRQKAINLMKEQMALEAKQAEEATQKHQGAQK